jgi:hypothetical protein
MENAVKLEAEQSYKIGNFSILLNENTGELRVSILTIVVHLRRLNQIKK